jgi:hypothetical protein
MKTRARHVVTAAVLVLAVASVRADTAADAYKAMGIRPADVLTGTVLAAKVVPGPDKQVVAVTSYFTGRQEADGAVNVRLDVFHRRGEALVSIYTRDFGAERGGRVGNGNLEIVDLDGDGLSDIVVSYESYAEPLIEQRLGEVIVHGPSGFRTAWTGPFEYDSTRAARGVPAERRDRYSREIDIARTRGEHGRTLHFTKEVVAVAGERLAEPKLVQESFPFDGAGPDGGS